MRAPISRTHGRDRPIGRGRRLVAAGWRDVQAWWPRSRRVRRYVTVPVTVAPEAAGDRAQVWDLILRYQAPAAGRLGDTEPPSLLRPADDQVDHGDEAFRRAVKDAWAWACVQDRYPSGGTITWSLRVPPSASGSLPEVGGESAGAAFAVGLAYLFGLTRGTRGRLDRRAVVSALVEPSGLLGQVGRLESKAAAVRDAGGRLVVAATAAEQARAASVGGRPPVVAVATVPEAVRESRLPRHRWPLVALLTTGALLVTSGCLDQQYQQWEKARQDRSVRRLMNQSAAEATGEIEQAASAALRARHLDAGSTETWRTLAQIAAADPRLRRVVPTGRPIGQLAYSPDGTLLASTSDGVVTTRNAGTGTVTATTGPLGGTVTAMAFLPGGHDMALGTETGVLLAWHPGGAEPRQIGTAPGGAVTSEAASPDGKRVVYGVDGKGVWVRPIAPGRPAIQITTATPTSVAFPNSTTVVAASAGAKTGDPILQAFPSDGTSGARVLLKKRLTAFRGGATALAVSPDGKLMVSADIGGGLRGYDTATLAERYHPVDLKGGIYAVAVGSDDRTVLTAAHTHPLSGGSATSDEDADVSVTDLSTGRPVGYALQGRRQLTSLTSILSLRPVSGEIAVATGAGAITLWRPPRAPDPAGPVWTVLPDPADKTAVLLFYQDGQVVREWPGTGRRVVVARMGGHGQVLTARLSPVHNLLAMGHSDGTVTLWHYPGMSPAGTLPAPPALPGDPYRVLRLAFSPDGRVLASGNPSGAVQLWWTGTGKPWLRLDPPRPSSIAALAFLPSSGELVVTRRDGLVQIFRLGATMPSRQAAMPSDAGVVLPVPGGMILGFGDGSYARYGTDLAVSARFAVRHDFNVLDGTLSADGRLLASAGADGQALVIDAVSGAAVVAMPSVEADADKANKGEAFYAGSYVSAAFTGDGRYAVFGAYRGQTESIALSESDVTRRVCGLAGLSAPRPAAPPGRCG